MKALLLTLCLLWPTSALAAVALDACTKATPASCTTCDTTAHTVGAGANYLVVFVQGDNDSAGTTVSAASWDQGGTPQAMTALADNNGVGAGHGRAFGLANPTAGNKTLRVTSSSSSGCCDIFICSFTGVNTSSPTGTIVETESTANVAGDSLAFTVGSGGLAVAFLAGPQTAWASFSQGADQTQQQINNGTGCNSDCVSITTTATISPMNYTWTATSRTFWHVVIPLNAITLRPVSPIILP
jgi:hypothetical protein